MFVFSDGAMDCLPAAELEDKELELQMLVETLPEPAKLWSRLCESLKNLDDVSLLAVQYRGSA